MASMPILALRDLCTQLLLLSVNSQGVAGTSASCPVVAAVIARLNAVRLAKGNAPLGFLNPFLYAHPKAFQDVTKGINSDKQSAGFTAIEGWDAATGLGTPDYEALLEVVNSM